MPEDQIVSSLWGESLKAQVAERRKLSRYLHDTVSQDLVALSLSLSHAQRDVLDRQALEDLNHSLELVDRCCREIRVISYALAPPLSEDLGIAEALKLHGEHLRAEAGLETELRLGQIPERFDPDTQAVILAAVQEGTVRALGRSDRKRIQIDLDIVEGRIHFRFCWAINDIPNSGDETDSAANYPVLRERLRALGGDLTVSAELGAVCLQIHFPLGDAV